MKMRSGRRQDRLVVVVGGLLAERHVVDLDLALQDQRAQLGVEVRPRLADLLEADLDQRRDPRPQRRDLDLIAVPAVEVEAAWICAGVTYSISA